MICLKRRILNILITQHEICEASKKALHKYTMSHGYCSEMPFNVPSEWIKTSTLFGLSEFEDFTEQEVQKTIEILIEENEIRSQNSSGCLEISYMKG